MTPDVVTVEDTAPVQSIARVLVERIKRVPVLKDGRVVGIVSRADLLKAVASAPEDHTAPGDEAIRIRCSDPHKRGRSM